MCKPHQVLDNDKLGLGMMMGMGRSMSGLDMRSLGLDMNSMVMGIRKLGLGSLRLELDKSNNWGYDKIRLALGMNSMA